MSYEIKTIEYHTADRIGSAARNARRMAEQLDVEDCALSSWADSQMQHYHSIAITLLENGKTIGIDGPAAEKTTLWDTDRDVEVDAKQIRTQYGSTWLLGDVAARTHGRRFIPIDGSHCGDGHGRSRVQKRLYLVQRSVMTPCSRWLRASCAGIGMPVSLHPQFDD